MRGRYLIRGGDVVHVENDEARARYLALGYHSPQRAPIDADLLASWEKRPDDPLAVDLRRQFGEELRSYHDFTATAGIMAATESDEGCEYMRVLCAARQMIDGLSSLLTTRDAAASLALVAPARLAFLEARALR